MDKKIEELEQRIKELEDKLNQYNNMFGRSYSYVGSSDSDFLIKTRGQVKVQWGSKFIDLIKDGKVNVNAKFIHNTNKVGTKDGIYVTDNGTNVTLVANGSPINLVGEIGTTYVSFLDKQETDSNQKRQALINIGLLYQTIEDVDSNALKNGIVYIENEHKLYTITDGNISEFKVSIPKPFSEQLIISKITNDTGAIVIKGQGISNSLAFNTLYIYDDVDANVIQSDKNLNIIAKEVKLSNVSIDNTLKSNSLESVANPKESGGYRLYRYEGTSILEIDKIIERDSDNSVIYPEELYLSSRIVKDASIIYNEDVQTGLYITFTQQHSFKVGDKLVAYTAGTSSTEGTKEYTKVLLEVINDTDADAIEVTSNLEDLSVLAGDLIGRKVVGISLVSGEIPLRIKDNNLDIVNYNGDNLESPSILARIGNLSPLNLTEINNGSNLEVNGNGIYSQQVLFDKASYSSNYDLPDNDNSSKLASTEWVRKFVSSVIS